MNFVAPPVLSVAVLAALGLLVAGCGGGKPGASVASLGTTSTTSGSAASSSTNGAGASGAGSGPQTSSGGGVRSQFVMRGGNVQAMSRFASCMRKNGEPNFPDPNAQGQIAISSSAGIDPGSAPFQHAQQACQKELPNGGVPTPAQEAQARQGALAFSACMRKNGMPNFPDPQFGPGGRVALKIGPGAGIDPQSPQFKHAQQVCQKDLPFGKGQVTAKAGG